MPDDRDSRIAIQELRQSILESGYFDPGLFQRPRVSEQDRLYAGPKIDGILRAQKIARGQMEYLASFITEHLIKGVLSLESKIRQPAVFDDLRQLLEQCLVATAEFRKVEELATVYGDLLSVYILVLYRCGAPGRQSPILKMILRNVARRKAAEIDPSRLYGSFSELENKVTISLLAKRYAVYILATRGFTVLFRSEIAFRSFGTSPEELALQVINLLIKHEIKLSEVTDLVCGGGDMGTLPDGIYVLSDKVREESWKRLQNSSLNRGPLVTWELRKLLRAQSPKQKIHASVCSPLTFSTLAAHHMNSLFREESRELELSLKGYVKITPLKATAALISEIERLNPVSLNLLVMTLDELFACVVRKIGARTVREMAAQEANKMLVDFDFGKICEYLNRENFVIPQHFRLASREIGTGVKEMCELIMIVESGKISQSLSDNLIYVVDSYARQVATVLQMASAGKPHERPDFILVTSTRARDPYFLKLFGKIRSMVDSSSTPLMCLDSLEYEYLIANHLFEMYVNPDLRDRRLHITVEARSMKHALQVLGSGPGGQNAFSFAGLLDEVTGAIADGTLKPANLVLVGADNEDALLAVSEAKEQGLLGRLAFIGDPDEVASAIERAKLAISPDLDPTVELISTDPLAIDADSKKKSMAEAFGKFIRENQDFIVIKGSIDTASLLHKALSIYRTDADSPAPSQLSGKKLATSTALFSLPDGRFFALSDAGVNPTFRNAEALLQAIENQVELVRKVVEPDVRLKLAIITAVEKVTSAIPATLLAAEAQQKAQDLEARYGPLVVEGPLSFDLATVPDSALEKHYDGKIRGDANCLMATDINTANVLYKMMSKTMGSLGLVVDNGAIITAGPNTVPIVLTSRGDTARTKFNSILLALAYASKRTNKAAGPQ